MKLKRLIKDFPDLQVKGSKEIEITGICSNSKLVAPGNLFIAKKGTIDDGSKYIPEALNAGAIAILSDIFDPSLNVTQLIHPEVTAIEGLLAAHYYQVPSKELFMVGVTGTNGKTTSTFIIRHLLEKLDGVCGLIGTVEYIIGRHRYQATRTTPDVISNHKMLREMVIQKCKSAVMEVTSHALEQGRVQHIGFDVAIFTNLTLDHLDYHGTMEQYCLAKNKLFRGLDKNKIALVNNDSLWTPKIIEGCKGKIVSYGIINPSDLQALDIQFTTKGTKFILKYEGKLYPCTIPLIGRFNVYNCLAAIGVALTKKLPLDKIIKELVTLPSPPGRLQAVPNKKGLKIYVDFAHSDDALANVLECLKEVKTGKILTVFGCGGNRDSFKRPKMAQVSENLSDFTIVTSDNPRNEKPEDIAKEIVAGFRDPKSFIIELDRREAIKKAVRMADQEDIILIAGKGHETYQIFAHKTIEFDDVKEAAQICEEL